MLVIFTGTICKHEDQPYLSPLENGSCLTAETLCVLFITAPLVHRTTQGIERVLSKYSLNEELNK